ncbi:hypothetical protein KBB89_00355 [Candidatus Gracilibacteria bacterium]|nr:hypothetical protein [Candidatus Gracilibacteria bacterium]
MKIFLPKSFQKTTLLLSFVLFWGLLFSFNFAFSLQPTTSEDEDPDMNLYTRAREEEEKLGEQYMNDGLQGFSEKLNAALKKSPELSKFFGKGFCDGCTTVVLPSLDQSLIDYLGGVPPLTKNNAYDFAAIVKPHLDPSISSINTNDVRALNTLMNIMSDSILTQIKEQMMSFRDISSMGLYYDGDTDNSLYDLMADLQQIDEKYFNEIPPLGPYKNTMLADVSGLISGQASPTGEWGNGGTSGAIALALGLSSVSQNTRLVASATCSGGVCGLGKENIHQVKPQTNAEKKPEPVGKNPNTFQNIFEKGTDWMVKYGANRNNACKIPPSWFFFQALYDQNASLAKMLSNAIYPVQEVPELLAGFMNRDTRKPESEDREIDDSIVKAFKNRGMDSLRPEAIIPAGFERAVSKASRSATDKDLPASASVYSAAFGDVAYDKYIDSLGGGMQSSFIKKHSIESMEHLSVTFEELASRSLSVNKYAETLNTISDYFLSKGECQPS